MEQKKEKCRYIALTDINPSHFPFAEKDDIQSLIRLLLYSNQIDIEGIVLVSSCFLKKGGGKKAMALVNRILDAYNGVLPNLKQNAIGYPSKEEFKEKLCLGIPAFGETFGNGFGESKYENNPGVQCIISALRKKDERPLWIGLWGGANTLAEALYVLEKEESPDSFLSILHKLRIYSISDQDFSAAWIREKYGKDLFYIVDPSKGDFSGTKQYCQAVWPGISADRFQHGSEDGIKGGGFTGADLEVISNGWQRKHIQTGPLGKHYPKTVFIMEGDTPSYLGLIPNGLNEPEHPEYGGWGGRYQRKLSKEGCYIYSGAKDTVMGSDQKQHTSSQATIWRWREEFQNDFAARMEWSFKKKEECIHPPVIKIKECIKEVKANSVTLFDASDSYSPDKDELKFEWFIYPELCSHPDKVRIISASSPKTGIIFEEGGNYHLILKLTSLGHISLTQYQRFVLDVKPIL